MIRVVLALAVVGIAVVALLTSADSLLGGADPDWARRPDGDEVVPAPSSADMRVVRTDVREEEPHVAEPSVVISVYGDGVPVSSCSANVVESPWAQTGQRSFEVVGHELGLPRADSGERFLRIVSDGYADCVITYPASDRRVDLESVAVSSIYVRRASESARLVAELRHAQSRRTFTWPVEASGWFRVDGPRGAHVQARVLDSGSVVGSGNLVLGEDSLLVVTCQEVDRADVTIVTRDAATGLVVQGATVRIGASEAISDSDGRSTIRVAMGRRLAVSVEHVEFAPAYQLFEASADLVEVMLDRPVGLVGRIPSRPDPVRGTVAIKRQRKVVALEVDPDGSFSLDGLPPNEIVVVSVAGFGFASKTSFKLPREGVLDVGTIESREMAELEIAFPTPNQAATGSAYVTWQTLRQRGSRLPSMSSMEDGPETWIESGGSTVLTVPAGKLLLRGQAGGRPLESHQLDLEAGSRARVELSLAAGVCAGVVVDEGAGPVEGAFVELMPRYGSPGARLQARSNAAGQFRFEHAPTGPASIRVRHVGARQLVRTSVPQTALSIALTQSVTTMECRLDAPGLVDMSEDLIVVVAAQGRVFTSAFLGDRVTTVSFPESTAAVWLESMAGTSVPVDGAARKEVGAGQLSMAW